MEFRATNGGSGSKNERRLPAKWMGSGGPAMRWLHNPGIQFLILIFVPGIVGCAVCVWAFNRLARRYEWRRKVLGR
jgi:hypothetical protein